MIIKASRIKINGYTTLKDIFFVFLIKCFKNFEIFVNFKKPISQIINKIWNKIINKTRSICTKIYFSL